MTSLPHRPHVTAAALTDELSSSLVRRSSRLFELTKAVVFLSVYLITINSLLATVVIVDGPSMEPNFHTNEVVLVSRLSNLKYQRGDVVILKYPGDPDHHQYIKRIVGLPGEKIMIQAGFVYVNGSRLTESYLANGLITSPNVAERTLGQTEFYTLGDNRPVSNDSRYFGSVDRRFFVGRVVTTLSQANS